MRKKHFVFFILVCEKVSNGKKETFLTISYRFFMPLSTDFKVQRVKNLINHHVEKKLSDFTYEKIMKHERKPIAVAFVSEFKRASNLVKA